MLKKLVIVCNILFFSGNLFAQFLPEFSDDPPESRMSKNSFLRFYIPQKYLNEDIVEDDPIDVAKIRLFDQTLKGDFSSEVIKKRIELDSGLITQNEYDDHFKKVQKYYDEIKDYIQIEYTNYAEDVCYSFGTSRQKNFFKEYFYSMQGEKEKFYHSMQILMILRVEVQIIELINRGGQERALATPYGRSPVIGQSMQTFYLPQGDDSLKFDLYYFIHPFEEKRPMKRVITYTIPSQDRDQRNEFDLREESFYPLDFNYDEKIIEFLVFVKNNTNCDVEKTLSTYREKLKKTLSN